MVVCFFFSCFHGAFIVVVGHLLGCRLDSGLPWCFSSLTSTRCLGVSGENHVVTPDVHAGQSYRDSSRRAISARPAAPAGGCFWAHKSRESMGFLCSIPFNVVFLTIMRILENLHGNWEPNKTTNQSKKTRGTSSAAQVSWVSPLHLIFTFFWKGTVGTGQIFAKSALGWFTLTHTAPPCSY